MKSFLYLIMSFMYGSLSFLFFSSNPVISLLFLINVFVLGTIFLMFLNVSFISLIFFMIYVGAIVVLFLFVVMMLDIKVNTSQNLFSQNSLTWKNFILFLFTCQFIFLFSEDNFISIYRDFIFYYQLKDSFSFWVSNFDFMTLLEYPRQVEVIGKGLYKNFIYPFILAGFILLIAMIGAIILSISDIKYSFYKLQNASFQSMNRAHLIYSN